MYMYMYMFDKYIDYSSIGLNIVHKTRVSFRHLPSSMFCVMTCTQLSRSGLLCSCQNPSACIISWMAEPFFRQYPVNEISCSPPVRPMLEKHLGQWKTSVYHHEDFHESPLIKIAYKTLTVIRNWFSFPNLHQGTSLL